MLPPSSEEVWLDLTRVRFKCDRDARDLLGKLARMDKGGNACRNLTRLAQREDGVAVRIPISFCPVRVRLKKPLRVAKVQWPVFKLEHWVKYSLQHVPALLLGGHQPQDPAWRSMFESFWDMYRHVNASHPCYADSEHWDDGLSTCIPCMIHGDEGRGLHRRPFLLISVQPVISHLGPGHVNESTHFGLRVG